MKTWTRATTDRKCGGCVRFLRAGDPMLVITIGRRRFIRCRHCEEAPPDLPAIVVTETGEQKAVRAAAEQTMFESAQTVFTRIHQRHLEKTIPLLVEREPGEDD